MNRQQYQRIGAALLVAGALLSGCDTTSAPAPQSAPTAVAPGARPTQSLAATAAPTQSQPANGGTQVPAGTVYPPPVPTYDPYAAPQPPVSGTATP